MATRAEILEQITDISVRVLACNKDAVTPDARFNELGSDSLTIVEIGEELGRRFDVYLSDDTIDTMRTVQDAIDAVAALTTDPKPAAPPTPPAAAAGAAATSAPAAPPKQKQKPAPTPPAAPTRTSASTTAQMSAIPAEHSPPNPHLHGPHFKRKALSMVTWMAIIGVLIGGFIGFGMSAMVSATGISEVSLPPINAASPTPTPTESTPSPTPKPSPTEDATPEPTLNAEKSQVSPGERFVLSGAFPEADEGVELQVQVSEPGTGWDDFPITTKTRADGRFKTELYTSRTGERTFRLVNVESGEKTPTVKVQIG